MKGTWLSIFYQGALWLCVVTLPLTIRVNSIALILLVIAWLATGDFKEKYENIKQARWVWLFFLFYGLYLVGLVYTTNLPSGLFELEKEISFVLLPLVIASAAPVTESFCQILKRSFVLSCAGVVLVSLVIALWLGEAGTSIPQNFDLGTNTQFIKSNPDALPLWQYFSYLQVGGWIDMHPAYFSMYLIFSIAILLHESLGEGRVVVWKIVLIIFFSFFLSFLATRMAVVTFIAAVLYIATRHLKERKRLVLTVPFLFLIVIFFVWLNPVSRFRLLQEPQKTSLTLDKQTTEWTSVSLRVLEWSGSMLAIQQHWLAGTGTGAAQDALVSFYRKFDTKTFNLNYNSHNQYLQTLVEFGLIGGLVLVAIVAYTLRRAWRANDTLYVTFILIFCLMCLTESMLERQKGIVFFTLFHSLFLRTLI